MREFIVNKRDRILVVSPHPDDECIGCGALLEKYGELCDVLLVTRGELGNPEWARGRTGRVRKKEFETAMSMAGVCRKFFLNLPDTQVQNYKKCIKQFDFSPYNYIFVPNREDNHPDHKAVYKAVSEALKFQRLHKLLCEYEVWSPLTDYTHYILYDSDFKGTLINCYQCQLKHIDYQRMSAGLGEFRGGLLAEHAKGEVYRIESRNCHKIACIFGGYKA